MIALSSNVPWYNIDGIEYSVEDGCFRPVTFYKDRIHETYTWIELIEALPSLPNGTVVTVSEKGVNASSWVVRNGALKRLTVAEFIKEEE